MGDHIKSLTEIKVDNMRCSSLIYQTSHFITEVYQIA